MKTNETTKNRVFTFEKPLEKTKQKSLRPMRSMMAVRSLKPKTNVAVLVKSAQEIEKRD